MKERLDVLLVKQGYAPSREKAKSNYHVRKRFCGRRARG